MYIDIYSLTFVLYSGTPVGAVTGTADKATQERIKNSLCLNQGTLEIYLSPNRTNLRFSVHKVKKNVQLKHLDWLVEKASGKTTPKTIVFCNTMNEIATVVNYLIYKLGTALYADKDPTKLEDSLIGIYHSNSWPSNKERIVSSLKGNGNIRVVIASTALCMGVNFPDIRYVINGRVTPAT